LGEPLRFATARAPEVRSAVARLRRAIRSITRFAGGSAAIPLAGAPEVRLARAKPVRVSALRASCT
jgi:hypothetical protein